MTPLRWTIGVVTVLVTLGVIPLAVIGGGFRRSFTGSDNSAPIVAIAVIFAGLVVASLVLPERRVLMHVVAVAMVGLCIVCAVIARQTVFVATVGMLYAAAWLVFYYRSVWR